MQDQIRQWFIEVRQVEMNRCMCIWIHWIILYTYRDATGKFPDFPDIDEGGSEVIFKKKEPEVGHPECSLPYVCACVCVTVSTKTVVMGTETEHSFHRFSIV